MPFIQALVRSCAGAHSGPGLLPLLIFSAKRHDLGVFLQAQRRVEPRGARTEPEGRRRLTASASNTQLDILISI